MIDIGVGDRLGSAFNSQRRAAAVVGIDLNVEGGAERQWMFSIETRLEPAY